MTPFVEIAKAFAHKPTIVSRSDDGVVAHNGIVPGYLYRVSVTDPGDALKVLPNTDETHWDTQRDLAVELVAEVPANEPRQLADSEVSDLRGPHGYRSDRGRRG